MCVPTMKSVFVNWLLCPNLNLCICSHVMTFFDRKVDLAQFPSDHPLYVMCRTWMRNDPSGSSEEPVRPVSPQVVTVCTCLDIMCTCILAYKWFIVCTVYLFIHARVYQRSICFIIKIFRFFLKNESLLHEIFLH